MSSTRHEPGDHDRSIAASQYASSVGRPSSEAAGLIVDMANDRGIITSQSRVLDVGTGTGAVTLTVMHRCPEAEILATDNSQPMLDVLRKNLPHDQANNVTTKIVDANTLDTSIPPNTFSHAFCSFVLQTATKDPLAVLRQMHATIVRDGVIGIGVWGRNIDHYTIWSRACRSTDPSYVLPEHFENTNTWRTPGELATNLEAAQFTDVQVISRGVPFPFESGKAYAEFWYGGKNAGAQIMIESWKGDAMGAREVVKQIVDRDFDGGKAIQVEVVLGVGRKMA